jgi:uncharacterized membrane protein YfcA
MVLAPINVPVLNLLMVLLLKYPLLQAVFTFITDTSAAWIYLIQGSASMIVVPSVIGIMLGSIVGVKYLQGQSQGIK